MTDAEQIEAWRSEFISVSGLPKDELIRWSKDSEFFYEDTENIFKGFCLAKRSQLVIELPAMIDIYTEDIVGNFYDEDAIHAAITAAGYKYKVKE